MVDYVRAAATADRLITAAGVPIKLTKQLSGEFDPGSDTINSVTPPSFMGYGVRLAYNVREIDGDRIRSGDMRVLLSIVTTSDPKPGDSLDILGSPWLIVYPKIVAPGPTIILYDLQVRTP